MTSFLCKIFRVRVVWVSSPCEAIIPVFAAPQVLVPKPCQQEDSSKDSKKLWKEAIGDGRVSTSDHFFLVNAIRIVPS